MLHLLDGIAFGVEDCNTGTASGDLHVHHAGGGSMDIRGFHGRVMNLHQAGNISLNAKFIVDKYTLAPQDPRSESVLVVNGSFLSHTYATVKTQHEGMPMLIHAGFGSENPGSAPGAA